MDYDDFGYDDFNEYDSPEVDDAEQYEMNCLAEDARLELEDDFEDDGSEEDFPEDVGNWESEEYYEPDFF